MNWHKIWIFVTPSMRQLIPSSRFKFERFHHMMGKKYVITQERLQEGGDRVKRALFKRTCAALKHTGESQVVLDCKYKGTKEEDAPLHSNTQVIYTWTLRGHSTDYETIACKMLHGAVKICAPRVVKQRLARSLLSEVVRLHRLVPGMQALEVNQVQCHAIAVPKRHTGTYETTYITKLGKRIEHVKLAHIARNEYFVHPGTVLSIAEMFPASVKEELPASGERKKPVLVPMKPLRECELRSRLFAVAEFRAELARAKAEGRDVIKEAAHSLFENISEIARLPKQVFVLWSSTTLERGKQEHASEVMLSSLCKARLP